MYWQACSNRVYLLVEFIFVRIILKIQDFDWEYKSSFLRCILIFEYATQEVTGVSGKIGGSFVVLSDCKRAGFKLSVLLTLTSAWQEFESRNNYCRDVTQFSSKDTIFKEN